MIYLAVYFLIGVGILAYLAHKPTSGPIPTHPDTVVMLAVMVFMALTWPIWLAQGLAG